MLRVVKIRIYPTEQQKVSLAKAFGTTRWVWNYFLSLTNQTYQETGKGIAKYDMIKQLPQLKKQEETKWLKETYSQSLQSVCLNLSRAFVNFFEKGKAIGLDLGLTHFCITSDSQKFDNPRWFKKHEHNLKVKQQQLSRKQKGSNNRNKSRVKVAKVHNKITRCREDFHHQLSRRIVNENQVLVLENLSIKNMVKNHNLAKAISQVGWGQICTMLKYKVEQEGKIYLEVGSSSRSRRCAYLNSLVAAFLIVRFHSLLMINSEDFIRDLQNRHNLY